MYVSKQDVHMYMHIDKKIYVKHVYVYVHVFICIYMCVHEIKGCLNYSSLIQVP